MPSNPEPPDYGILKDEVIEIRWEQIKEQPLCYTTEFSFRLKAMRVDFKQEGKKDQM